MGWCMSQRRVWLWRLTGASYNRHIQTLRLREVFKWYIESTCAPSVTSTASRACTVKPLNQPRGSRLVTDGDFYSTLCTIAVRAKINAVLLSRVFYEVLRPKRLHQCLNVCSGILNSLPCLVQRHCCFHSSLVSMVASAMGNF